MKTTKIALYETTIRLLRDRKGEWRQLSDDVDVPYSTFCKIAQRHHKNPSVHTIEKIYNRLQRQ